MANNEKIEFTVGKRAFFLQFLSILSGYSMMLDMGAQSGWPSPALPYLKSENSKFFLSKATSAWLVSIINISGIIGTITATFLMNRIGRRLTLLIFALLQLISWILVYFAENLQYLFIARFFVGLSSGGPFVTLPVYIGEISHKNYRGTLLSLDKLFLSIGTFFINVLGLLPYRTMNLIMILVPILSLCLFSLMHETPYYLLMKNRDDEAIETLMKLLGVKKRELIIKDIERMKNSVIEYRKCEKNSIYQVFRDKGSRRGLISFIIAELTFVFSGIIAIHAYAQEIFSYSESTLRPVYASMIMSGVQIIAGFPSSRFSDKLGRRPIYLISGLTTALTLGIVGLFFFLKYFLLMNVSKITWLPLIGLILYQFTCNIGITTIPFVYSGELFSIKVKGVAIMFCAIIGSVGSFLTKMMIPFVNDFAGIYTTFWIFASACVIGPILLVVITPETKGKTLEEVLELMREKNKMRNKKEKCFVT
ncbi:facilitated trehalose transporter Tret1-like [Leptopilina boulardi]|uniref:facilitated trehalose transporter Tret1-like n=1 Tax=Leptopilina boulardi TaxID=63433 RepID=UPI0021F676B5|nr:facilitated trehalose transporter Tret1-like [Leptopilina boulardi]